MWKARPDEKPPAPALQPSAPPGGNSQPVKENRPLELSKPAETFRADVAAHIGKSVLIKGELSGSEDLYLDGEVEGTIDLRNHSLTVGPNGKIRANISAREIVLHGRVEGNVTGAERVELKKSCVMVGDIMTQRVVIEDGAFFKGSVDLQKEHRPEARKAIAASAASGATSSTSSSMSSNPLTSPQTSLLEQK